MSRRYAVYVEEIERLGIDLVGQDMVTHHLSTELARVKAERDEAVELISGLITCTGELATDRLCEAHASAFLARMEGQTQ